LFELANRIVARETDQIDQVFRMRHADGQWVWMRARAQVVDPNAPELHLIGIAVDVTEQQPSRARSETADHAPAHGGREHHRILRAVGRQNKLVHVQHQVFSKTLPFGGRHRPGTRKATDRSSAWLPYTVRRRLANANGPRGGASYERQLADGRWLQVNELKTPDGGVVSVGADITQLKQQQEKLVDSERRLMATSTTSAWRARPRASAPSNWRAEPQIHARDRARRSRQPSEVGVPRQHVA
jgi:two-component system cell cycle sensor histidine kinase PleC